MIEIPFAVDDDGSTFWLTQFELRRKIFKKRGSDGNHLAGRKFIKATEEDDGDALCLSCLNRRLKE